MAAILSDVSLIVTESISWIGDYVDVITGQPLLLMFTVTSFVGLGVGLIRRLIRL